MFQDPNVKAVYERCGLSISRICGEVHDELVFVCLLNSFLMFKYAFYYLRCCVIMHVA